MRIGDRDLDERVLVIAEIGNNHEGDIALAEELIGLAARAGADAVKLQTIDPELLASPLDSARLAQLHRFALGDAAWARLASVAADHGVLFLSTPFSLRAVSLLDPLVPAFKVASGDLDFRALLEAVAQTGKPLIVSTGMATLEEVERAKDTIENIWESQGVAPGLVLVHCVVSYPTDPADANLSALPDLARLGAPIGYSDHTVGVEAAAAAVALGARIVEKHFTLDKQHSGFRDHQLSADPAEMAELVRRIRLTEELVGSGGKRVLPVEADARSVVRRGATAARALPAGHLLTEEDILVVRPASGLSAWDASSAVGRRLRAALERGAPLGPDAIEAR